MGVLKIEGGHALKGSISVGGSKNAALAILASLPLIDGVTVLENLPKISDVRTKLRLLESFGAVVTNLEDGSVEIDTRNLHHFEPGDQHVRLIRTSFYLLGPLLARFGQARLPAPGGCAIGERPVDFHIMGLGKLGAPVTLEGGIYSAVGPNMRGTEIRLDFPSAGATQHLMATACLVPGHTTIQHAAMEPEVVQLATFLKAAGARIEGEGTPTISIQGVDKMEGCTYRVPADRIQVGTYLLAAAITGGDITCTQIMPEYQAALVGKLIEAGVDVEESHDQVRVRAVAAPQAVKVRTMPYPGFATDMQQPMAAFLTQCNGTSVIEETIYENRVGHVAELQRMGANISSKGQATTIIGQSNLTGAMVQASDLRAGAALVLAALAAKGTSHISNVHYIDRGYEELESNLTALGALVERLPGEISAT